MNRIELIYITNYNKSIKEINKRQYLNYYYI